MLTGTFALLRDAHSEIDRLEKQLSSELFRVYQGEGIYVVVMFSVPQRGDTFTHVSDYVRVMPLDSNFQFVQDFSKLTNTQLDFYMKYRKYLGNCDFPPGDEDATERFLKVQKELVYGH